MLALTPHVAHKILFERIQFAMFLQLLGQSPQIPTWTPLETSVPRCPPKLDP